MLLPGSATHARRTFSSAHEQDSLVTTELQSLNADCLQFQASQPGLSVAEQRALHEQAWLLVCEEMEVVSRRHTSDTLGHNKCRPDEVQYMTRRATSDMPTGGDAAQRTRFLDWATTNATSFGVTVSLHLARLCLYRLHNTSYGTALPPLAAPERGLPEHFVYRALDYLASTRAGKFPILGETELVHVVQQVLALPVMEPSFRAALEARWTSPDVVASLSMRGTIERSTAVLNNTIAESEAAHRADVAEHGLLVCALPGCDKQEVTVREFKVCSACRAVAYCSAEHGGLHWAGGHKHECNDLKAAGAKPARAT